MEKRTTALREDLRHSIALLALSEVSPRYFTFVTSLALMVTVLSTYSIGLLVPLAHGIITGSFTQLLSLPGVSWIVHTFPTIFSTPVRTFLLLVVLLYVLTLSKSAIQYYAQLHAHAQAKQATVRLREKLFAACISLNKHFYDAHKVSNVHHTFMRLPQVLESQFRALQRFATHMILVLVYLVLMFIISWKLALIVAFVFPIIMFISYRVLAMVRTLARSTEGQTSAMSSQLLDVLFKMPIVQGFSKEQYELERFTAANQEEIEESFRTKQLTNLIEPLEEITTTTAALFVALGIAFLLHTGNAIEPALLFVFFFLTVQVLRSISVFSSLKVTMASAEPALEQLQTLLHAQATYQIPQGAAVLPPITSGITIRNLSFTYPQATAPTLNGVSCEIPKGKVIALVGPTGSGKSTIGNLLLRLYDCSPGTIFIDGKDIRTFTIESVRARMSFVYQDPLLFSTTIEQNAQYALTDALVTDSSAALKRFCLGDVVTKHHGQSHNTESDETSRLSGGQKRLVALVRAMLRTHDFLLLDEATNSLDATTEQIVLDEVLAQSKEKTVLLISHRLSAIKRAEHIVYLEHGRVVEQGTYTELMERGGPFTALWK